MAALKFGEFFESDCMATVRVFLGREPSESELILLKGVAMACWRQGMEEAAKACEERSACTDWWEEGELLAEYIRNIAPN